MTPTASAPSPVLSDTAPFLQVLWHDDVTPARGYVVIDRMITGMATGGTRMRPGCTLDEVTDLAREMTLKMGAYGIHVGGAKGGIDFDPSDPGAAGVRLRFVQAMRPLLERFWVTAGDLGTQQAELDQTFAEAGLGGTTFHAAMVRAPDESAARARVANAFGTPVDGLLLSELIGGFGVAEAALAGLEYLAVPPSTARVVVQGFGAMGGSTALYLARAGVRVVGVADALGMVVNRSRGLDVELLLAARSGSGVIDRGSLRPDDTELPNDAWLAEEVDVLVPAAVSYAITADNCTLVRARLIVEAANVPTTADAEQWLLNHGTVVVPDFLANTGAAAGAWWVILGEASTPDETCARLSAHVRPLVGDLLSRAAANGVSLRSAAGEHARESSRRMSDLYGTVVAGRELFSATHPHVPV